jgi:hypothetical protein
VTRPLVVLAIALLVCAGQAGSHECVEFSRGQAFKWATVVFRGMVTQIEDPVSGDEHDPLTHKAALQPASEEGPRVVTFSVTRAWKGPVTRTMKFYVLNSPQGGLRCSFRRGTEYVVYGRVVPGARWSEPVRKLTAGYTVYWIGPQPCVPRVRTDVVEESKALGRGWAPK